VSDTNVVDQGTLVGSLEDETDLTDGTMKDSLHLLDEFIGVDGQTLDILVLDKSLSGLAPVSVVEVPVAVHAVVPGFQLDVSKDILRVTVTVHPNQRYLHPVHVLERFGGDGSTVGALETSLTGVSTEIGFYSHFDRLLLTLWLRGFSLAPTEPK
jgi:hypothetical protein